MQRNHLSFFLAPRIPFAAADLVADARARTEINSHFGASAGRADARRRDEVDGGHRRGAATKPIRAPSGCGPQARWLCCSLLTYRPGYSSSLAPRQRAWGPAAKCEFISARALRQLFGPTHKSVAGPGRDRDLKAFSRSCYVLATSQT